MYAWSLHMNRDILSKTSKFEPCIKTCQKIKTRYTNILHQYITPIYCTRYTNIFHIKTCEEPDEEFQIDFGGSIYNEKDWKFQFLPALVFLNFHQQKSMNTLILKNIQNLIKKYILLHGVPQLICFDQARSQISK